MKPSETFIQDVMNTFGPYYERPVTREEAEEIISNWLRLFEVVGTQQRQCGELNHAVKPKPITV